MYEFRRESLAVVVVVMWVNSSVVKDKYECVWEDANACGQEDEYEGMIRRSKLHYGIDVEDDVESEA